MNPKQIVERGYDQIAERHAEWASRVRTEERARYAGVLLDRLSVGAEVLELGCGAGMPTTHTLAERFMVTGVDISSRQIAMARANVPNARFIQADMTRLELLPDSFDGIAAFYSIFHVPRDEHPALLRAIATWLRAGGLLVAAMSVHSSEGEFEPDWLGAPMYWSSFDRVTNERLVREAGLEILRASEETAEEDGEPITFLWIIAQKPKGLPR